MKQFSRFFIPMSLTLIPKRVLAASVLVLLGALMSPSAKANFEISSKNRSEVDKFQLAPIYSEEPRSISPWFNNHWLIGRWQIPGNLYLVEATYWCSEKSEYDFWPSLNICEGDLRIVADASHVKNMFSNKVSAYEALETKEGRSYHEKKMQIMDYQIKTILAFRGEDEVRLSSESRSYSNEFAALQEGGRVLSIDGQNYELEGFDRISEAGRAITLKYVNQSISKQRKEIVIFVLLVCVGLLGFIAFCIYLKKVAPRHAAKLRAALQSRAAKLKAAHQRHKVRGVMMDETIRVATRDALQSADAQSREVLIAELRKAIESGNHELANALELALKKA